WLGRWRCRPALGAVAARPPPVALQGELDVVGVLPAELRHVERRIDVPIAGNRVAAVARLRELPAVLGVALQRERRERGRGRLRQQAAAAEGQNGEGEGLHA